MASGECVFTWLLVAFPARVSAHKSWGLVVCVHGVSPKPDSGHSEETGNNGTFQLRPERLFQRVSEWREQIG